MRAVILAAGVGSRLGKPYPKSLNRLPSGETILGRQIRILREKGINEIFIIVGFKKELIMESFPEVYYRYNPVYYVTNTSKSLLCGLSDMDDDVLWTNGDVIFDEEIIDALLRQQGNAVAVNNSRCAEEEVKYTLGTDGTIVEISKTVKDAKGEAVGINKILKKDLAQFKACLAQCEDMDYFEKGLEFLIEKGSKIYPVDISHFKCIEVDFEEDWNAATELFTK